MCMTWLRRLNKSLVLGLSKVFKIDGLMSAEPLLRIFYVMRIGTEFIGRWNLALISSQISSVKFQIEKFIRSEVLKKDYQVVFLSLSYKGHNDWWVLVLLDDKVLCVWIVVRILDNCVVSCFLDILEHNDPIFICVADLIYVRIWAQRCMFDLNYNPWYLFASFKIHYQYRNCSGQ